MKEASSPALKLEKSGSKIFKDRQKAGRVAEGRKERRKEGKEGGTKENFHVFDVFCIDIFENLT